MGKNVFKIEGNVAQDVRSVGEGDKLCCFLTVAVNREIGNGSDFVSVKAFRDLAKSAVKTVKKGDRLCVTGRISTGSYEKGGKKFYTQDLICEEIEKLPALKRVDAVKVVE